ncbi:MAG: hypothetical protein QNJ87_11110 [Gammaproteobacteria bacterium]|nr:hypothetical protein [Gammaproteobacteria bacterium]MDJ0872302.1 hypothetical protein [Gammaproteobacteria bacterium]
MDPFLVDMAKRLESLDDRKEITEAMDQIEYLYEALDPHQQDLASELMARLQRRLRALRSGQS